MAINPEPDYYEILGVEHDATAEEIDKAFKKARRDAHPDRSPTGAWAFRLVETAYETLKDSDSRAAYDEAQRAKDRESSAPPSPPKTENTQSTAQTQQAPKDGGWNPQHAQSQQAKPQENVAQSQHPEDVVTFQDYEYEQTDLEKFTFSPPTNRYLKEVLIALGVALVGSLGVFLTWFDDKFPAALAFAAFALTLVSVGLATQKSKNEKSSLYGMVALVIGWVLIGIPLFLIENPIQQPIYLIAMLVTVVGGIAANIFVPKLMDVRTLDKRIPVKLLKDARIYGSPTSANPHESAFLRNISTTISPITAIKDGTFLLHVSDFKTKEKDYPAHMVIIRGNKVVMLTYMMGNPGNYGVTNDGNIVRIIGQGLTHVENVNPMVLAGCSYVKKSLPDIETKSLVVVIPAYGNVVPYHADETSVVPRQDALKTLIDFFEEPVTHVRRDLIDLFVPSISSSR